MNKKTLTKVSERYEAPSLEILSVSMEGVLCQSPYGEAGKAGATGVFYSSELESEDY